MFLYLLIAYLLVCQLATAGSRPVSIVIKVVIR